MTKYGEKPSACEKKITVCWMISTVQSYTNPVRSFYWTAPIHMLELLRHSNGSHNYVPIQVYNSTLRIECIANTILAAATLWRESTYITCPVNPYWQVTAGLSYRNIIYLNCLWFVHSDDSTQYKKKPQRTLRSIRVSIVAVQNCGKYTLLLSGCKGKVIPLQAQCGPEGG